MRLERRGTSTKVVTLNKMAMNTAPHVPGNVGLQPRIEYGAGSVPACRHAAISPHPGPLPRERGQMPNERTGIEDKLPRYGAAAKIKR